MISDKGNILNGLSKLKEEFSNEEKFTDLTYDQKILLASYNDAYGKIDQKTQKLLEHFNFQKNNSNDYPKKVANFHNVLASAFGIVTGSLLSLVFLSAFSGAQNLLEFIFVAKPVVFLAVDGGIFLISSTGSGLLTKKLLKENYKIDDTLSFLDKQQNMGKFKKFFSKILHPIQSIEVKRSCDNISNISAVGEIENNIDNIICGKYPFYNEKKYTETYTKKGVETTKTRTTISPTEHFKDFTDKHLTQAKNITDDINRNFTKITNSSAQFIRLEMGKICKVQQKIYSDFNGAIEKWKRISSININDISKTKELDKLLEESKNVKNDISIYKEEYEKSVDKASYLNKIIDELKNISKKDLTFEKEAASTDLLVRYVDGKNISTIQKDIEAKINEIREKKSKLASESVGDGRK